MDVSSVFAPAQSTSAAENSSAKLSDTFDSFLTLLTAQLTHQDPLEPLDPNQFTDQLVAFTNVEQSIATNKNLEQLLSLQQLGELSSAVNLIGTAIEAGGPTSVLKSGSARWAYALESQAETTNLRVLDSTGKAVFSTSGQQGAGIHNFAWDGKDSADNVLPDGLYTLVVSAEDSQGNDIDAGVDLIATVEGILTEGGVNKVDVGGLTIPLSSIVSVKTDA